MFLRRCTILYGNSDFNITIIFIINYFNYPLFPFLIIPSEQAISVSATALKAPNSRWVSKLHISNGLKLGSISCFLGLSNFVSVFWFSSHNHDESWDIWFREFRFYLLEFVIVFLCIIKNLTIISLFPIGQVF